MDRIIVEMTSTASVAIALFGVVYCFLQSEFSSVSRSFAVFLFAVAVSNLPEAMGRIFETLPSVYAQRAELIIWSPCLLSLAPLFWGYVFRLTSSDQRRPRYEYRHFLLPAFAFLVGLIIVAAPQTVEAAIFSDVHPQLSGWHIALVVFAGLFQFAPFPQIAVYLFLILRRLMRYRIKLRDVYASTEGHELRWIYVIGGLGGAYWLFGMVILIFVLGPNWTGPSRDLLSAAALFNLALVAALTIWGLRQRPPLVPDIKEAQVTQVIEAQTSDLQSEKYKKSALTAEASKRIARKLRMAMEEDHLHRDPNISLWILAKHIGASPNYISQTLSEVIGESFFDFVNGYRIAEAMTLLTTTNDTILNITYDVGFNARSSFYNAFKRVTGQTPTSYRKTMSHPVGMDDITK